MPLTPGARLGPYEIISLLGAGGMGEVYRAMDPRLHRQVAVKVLSSEMANDPTVRQRFEIEARAASNISHPNIVAVYDFGNQDGVLYIVWELVEGKPLGHEALPLKVALEVAAQIADGIAAAHSSGIVHRDLKPDNVIVTADGRAKILDFGLAKRTTRGLGGSNTPNDLSATQSQPGMMMGTIGYMSPEQVKGREVDHRTDIFSFGLVLYEMLAGRKAFPADSAIAVLHAIVNADPPEMPETVPLPVRQMVQHCLEKSPDQRFQSARDLCFALRAISGTATRTGLRTSLLEGPAKPWYKSPAALAVMAGLGLAAVGAFFAGRMLPGGGGAGAAAFQELTFRRGFVSGARFAPGGRNVAYSASWGGEPITVFQSQIGSAESSKTGIGKAHLFAVSKQGELAIALEPRFDPYTAKGKLARVPLSGGAPREVANNVAEADWDSKGENIAVVTVNGSSSRLEYPPGKTLYESSGAIRGIRFSPQGDKIGFFDHPLAPQHGGELAVVDLSGKKSTVVANRLALEGLVWSPDGKEIWFGSGSDGAATRIEAASLEGKIRVLFTAPSGLHLHDAAPDGTLLLTRRDDYTEMVGVRAEDTMHPANLSWLNSSTPRQIASDNQKVLFTEFSAAAGHNHAVGLRGMDGSPVVRLGEGDALALSPDGNNVLAMLHGRPPQFVIYPIGTGKERKLPPSGVEFQTAAQFHPDGQSIIFEGGTGKADLLWQQNLSSGQSRAFSPEKGVKMSGQAVSPDGEYVCAVGPDQKLSIFPIAGGAVRQIAGTTAKDRFIRWNADGKQVYIYDPHEVPIRVESVEVATGKRTLLLEYTPLDPTGVHYVDAVLSPDGKRAVYGLHRFLTSLQAASGIK